MSRESLSAQKSNLRERIGRWRDKLTDEERRVRSAEICRNLQQVVTDFVLPKSRMPGKPLTVLTYLPFRSEVDVLPFVKWCWRQNYQVVVPKVSVQDKTMSLHIISGLHETSLGAYGIREPRADLPIVHASQLDMIVMPGLAFDAAGRRLGYGGGYYDRLLAQAAEEAAALPLLVAPCFALQVVDVVPTEAHDFRVDLLVTEQRICCISKRG